MAEEIARYGLAFVASLILVFLKAMQQRNVAFDNYWMIPPTSLGLAAAEVYVVYTVSQAGWHIWLVLSIAAGASIGCLSAMLIHKKWIMRWKR